MSAYDFETVVKKWERTELTVEQAIGQFILLFQGLSDRVGQLEKAQQELRVQVKNNDSHPSPTA